MGKKEIIKVREYHSIMIFYNDGSIDYKRENINCSVIEQITSLKKSLNYLCNLMECDEQLDSVKSNNDENNTDNN